MQVQYSKTNSRGLPNSEKEGHFKFNIVLIVKMLTL